MAIVSKAERVQAEAQRLAAAEVFTQEVPQAEIARRLGVTATAACEWHRQWLAEGVEATPDSCGHSSPTLDSP